MTTASNDTSPGGAWSEKIRVVRYSSTSRNFAQRGSGPLAAAS